MCHVKGEKLRTTPKTNAAVDGLLVIVEFAKKLKKWWKWKSADVDDKPAAVLYCTALALKLQYLVYLLQSRGSATRGGPKPSISLALGVERWNPWSTRAEPGLRCIVAFPCSPWTHDGRAWSN